jgi:3-isopropylmalate/(R)-2-methylmalate dehydratase small subunit
MDEKSIIKGKVWIIRDKNNCGIDNIDTDQIFHNKFLAITDMSEMGQHIFGNLDAWKNFPNKVKHGDIIIAGKNFGSGSSRQQAVDGFIALGVSAIIAESFGAIYWRNGLNAGFPLLRAPNIMKSNIETGDKIEIDIENRKAVNVKSGKELPVLPMSELQIGLFRSGGLFEFGRKMSG